MINSRDVEYIQTTTLQEGIRKLEIKLDIDNDIQQQERRLNMMDCSSGYDVVFENWWTNGGLSGVSVDPVNVTYEDTNDNGGNSTEGNFTLSGVMVGAALVGTLTQIETNISYNLEAYECDENNAPVIVPVYNQGDLFRICIKPDEVATSDGLFMRQLDSMYYSKSDVDVIQYAIEGGQRDFFGLSKSQCTPGSSVCWVESIIKAEFYASAGFVNIAGIGSLQFGSSPSRRSRSLYNSESDSLGQHQHQHQHQHPRELQDQGRQERGRFAFQFPDTTFQDTMKYRTTKSNSMSNAQAIILVFLCFTFTMNCVFIVWIRLSRRSDDDDNNSSSSSNNNNISRSTNNTDHQEEDLLKRGKSSKRTKHERIDRQEVVAKGQFDV